MIVWSLMASGKCVNEVCGLIKMRSVLVVAILNLLKWHCLSRRYAKQTNILTTPEHKTQ